MRRPQPPGLVTASVVKRRVGQAPRHIGFVERCLAVPGELDRGAVCSLARLIQGHDAACSGTCRFAFGRAGWSGVPCGGGNAGGAVPAGPVGDPAEGDWLPPLGVSPAASSDNRT